MAYDVVTSDGERYTGETADDIVSTMASEKFAPVKSLGSYRKATAQRIKRLFGKEIDPSTSETYVESMLKANLLFPAEDA